MTDPVPAHGDQHHPMPGYPTPAPAAAFGAPPAIDYTGGAGRGTEVPVDEYAAAGALARREAELAAREQLAEQQQVPHRDDQPAAPEAYADMRAEVDAEQAEATVTEPERSPTPEHAFEVTLTTRRGTDTVRILDPNEWPSSANSALHVGEYESWAEGCLAPGDYEQVWLALDPSLGDVNRMFKEWRERTGRDSGKSSRSPASLKRAARR